MIRFLKRLLTMCREKLGQDTDTIHDKTQVLKRETARLAEDKATLQFSHTLAKITEESDKQMLIRDRKALNKLQDHRAELKARLEGIHKSLAVQGAADMRDLLIEEDFVKKRLDDVEKLIREEIKQV
jgi:hypothetical protein